MPAIRIEIQGQSFDAPLPEAPVRIGRAEDADLRIQGDGVASDHCVLEPLGGGRTKIKDSGSGYDTKVNGVAIKQISLNDGDVVAVGAARITYLATAASAPATPAKPAAAKPAKAKPAKPKAASKPAKPAAAPSKAAAAGSATRPTTKDGVPLPPPPPAAKAKAKKASKPADVKSDAPTAKDADESVVEEAVAAAPTSASERPRDKRRVPVLGIMIAVALAIGGFIVISGLGGPSEVSFERRIADGQRLYDAQDYAAARAAFEVVRDGAPEASPLKGRARDGLALVTTIEREMDGRLERLAGEGLDLSGETLAAERRRFIQTYGERQAPRFDGVQGRILAAQRSWKEQNLEATRSLADEHVADSQFVEALDVWQTLRARAPTAIDVSDEVDAALREVEVHAHAKADELVTMADEWNQSSMAYRSVKLFDDMLPRFRGLAAEAKLKAAQKIAIAEKAKPVEVAPTVPGPRTEDRPKPPTEEPRPVPPTETAAQKSLLQRADEVIAKAGDLVARRRFRDAASQLATAARVFPAGPARARIEGRASDLGLAARGKDALVVSIKASPDRYAGIRLAPRLRADLFDADAEYLHARVTGGSSKHAWARLPASAFPRLVTRLKPGAELGLAPAALLHVVGETEPAESALYTAAQRGVATDDVFATLARWRGIGVPAGGFVVYEDRYVTPDEREFLIREEQIKAALTMLDSKKAGERRSAAEALLQIGAPAAERFADALRRRRAFLADEVVTSKSFTGGKYKAKLLQLLDERRKHALALIYDAAAYPYPNPQKRNQAEVEARVDKVREVWERPFDLVAQWDKKLQERLQGLTEVDEYLARLDPSYRPDLDALKARINKAIDVPGSADSSKREYSLKVLVYNVTLKTTAGREEKNNVRSVNNYRMMMGLLAVKIDEKLTRAARGHSRHMATNQYFSHDVPSTYATPTNRTPGLRAKAQGFGGGVGENIARGPSTGHGAFLAWFGSSGHHRNMLGRGWLVLGAGRANQTWWTQNFGGGSKSLKAPDPLPPPAPAFAPDPEDKERKGDDAGGAQVPDDAPPSDGRDGNEPEDDPDDGR